MTISPVYWAPAGYSFPASYKTVVNGYLANVAAASATNGNVFGVADEYYQNVGSGNQFISYHVTAGSEVDATDSYPAEGNSYPTSCTPETGFGLTACVTDPALQTEVQTVLTAHGLTADDSHMYVVFFPPNVQTCFGMGVGNCSYSGPGSHGSYCAYHNGFGTIGTARLYADMPYPPLNGCSGGEAPNADAEADAMVSLISHETNETITDYDNAWRDSQQFEDGDECAYTYGVPIGGAGGALYNQAINGSHYYTQDEFSNANYALSQGDVTQVGGVKVNGCVQRPNSIATNLVVTAPGSATSGSPVSVTVKAVDGSANTVTGYTGTVHFTSTDGAATLPANYTFVAADNGIHTFSVTFHTTGSQTVTATDANTGGIAGTSGAVTVTAANLRPTTTTATATPPSSAFGQSVSYGAHVAPTTGTGVPTGTVTFTVGATTLCTTSALDGSGNGSCSASNAPQGTDTVTATYSGDATFAGSSGTTTETVSGPPRPTTTSPSATPTFATLGQSIAYSATVAPSSGSGTPTGTVTFTTSSGTVTLCTTPALVAGAGSCSATSAPLGFDNVVATYTGDGTFATSTGSTFIFVQQGTATTTTASANPTNSTPGQSVSYSAHVASGSGTPTGTVTFTVGATTLCTTPALDGSGNGSCSASNAPVGVDTVTATYSGDSSFSTSSGTTTEIGRVPASTDHYHRHRYPRLFRRRLVGPLRGERGSDHRDRRADGHGHLQDRCHHLVHHPGAQRFRECVVLGLQCPRGCRHGDRDVQRGCHLRGVVGDHHRDGQPPADHHHADSQPDQFHLRPVGELRGPRGPDHRDRRPNRHRHLQGGCDHLVHHPGPRRLGQWLAARPPTPRWVPTR